MSDPSCYLCNENISYVSINSNKLYKNPVESYYTLELLRKIRIMTDCGRLMFIISFKNFRADRDVTTTGEGLHRTRLGTYI